MKYLTLAGTATLLLLASCKSRKEYNYETALVEKTDITTSVTATGTIEPVTSVDVGTQVSGIVSRLYVDYNSVVKAGQVIAELDRTNLQSDLESAQANLRSAKSALDYQKSNYDRYKNLFEKGLISANEYEQARLSYVQAQQSVKRAQTNLGYATITSPIDGVVLSKEVEEGQTVASSFSTPTLFKIARDLTDMRVIADVDEADIGDVREGLRVTFTVDAFPEDTFEGSVTQVRQQGTTESNVVTYEVVISAPNQDLKLKPGLTANVTIHTLDLPGVTAVSQKALRFTPSEQTLNEGESIQDAPKAKNKVWVKEGNVIKAVPVEIGSSSPTHTQILSGVKEGQKVIIGTSTEQPEETTGQASNPFMPRRKNNKAKS